MRHFQLMRRNIDIVPLHHALIRQPDLWNQNTFRTTYAGTPHVDVDDIWLRFSALERTADTSDLDPVQNDAGAVWYPAADKLPEAKPLVVNLMHYMGAYELGRLLITRIPPGGKILPHADVDGDYVQQNDIARYHLVVQGLPGSLFRCGGEQIDMLTGEIWWFRASEEHEIVNNSAEDRIHLIADLRRWPC